MLKTEEKKRLNIIWTLWASLLGTLAVYVLICHIFGHRIKFDLGPDMPVGLIKNILVFVSALEIVAAGFIRKFLLTLRKSPENSRIIERYTAAVLVSLALSESVGIYGLILFFISKDFPTLYSFIALSAAAMVFYRPKTEEFGQFAALRQ